MTNDSLLDSLASVERIASMGKFNRMLHNPVKYLFSILYLYLIYPVRKKEIIVKARLFNGNSITIALPASTDIYLTGGKSHRSEINLAKYLIKNLHANSVFIDVGAHYGYFSLIASDIVKNGRVFSFEPSSKSFNILKRNILNKANATIFNKAVSHGNDPITFYEFDNLHSEYNSTQVAQFENEDWFKSTETKIQKIDSVSLSGFCDENVIYPDFIKIDVEGFENEVIKGAEHLLTNSTKKPIVVMEYLEPKRGNTAHQEAFSFLSQWGYLSYIIDHGGNLIAENDIDGYLLKNALESDNIVFVFGRT
ncbi:MAG: FkbM family methyltransferase [Saprospiraceae bacterium]